MKNTKRLLLSRKAIYYGVIGWTLYNIVRPVLKLLSDPFCNWIEEKIVLLYVPRHSLEKARLFLDLGIDPSNNEPVLLFSSIQAGIWNLGRSYGWRYDQQRVKDLMAEGFFADALNLLFGMSVDRTFVKPWEKRRIAEILALQAGRPLPPVLEPAEGFLCWSVEKVLEELPNWKKENIDYIIAELYLRWEYRLAADGRKRLVKRGAWDAVMKKIKEKFPDARVLRWHGSCACQAFNYMNIPLDPEELVELKKLMPEMEDSVAIFLRK